MSFPKHLPARARKSTLSKYRERRDFAVTSEPRGRAARHTKEPIFVVQKHDARRLHYDFRLEHDGVLWSWAVPKGPSLDPSERRLAARTEDHPLDYAGFEGVIPEGEYGAGPVIVWDRGTWKPEGDPAAAMAKGHIAFSLEGEKLRGRFHLVRLKPRGREKESWLLFKSRDESADADEDLVATRPESVASGRTIEDVSAKPAPRSRSARRQAPVRAQSSVPAASRVASVPAARTARPTSRGRVGRSRSAARQQADVADALRSLPLGFELTNLDRLLYPGAGVRKVHLLAYYASIAQILLPHVAGRPLAIVRCPGGMSRKCFFQKHVNESVPDAVDRLPMVEDGESVTGLMIHDLNGLVALGQIGVLEIHAWMCHADEIERPDQIVLDLDPDVSLPFSRVVETALLVRDRLADLGLESFVKTTGGKGLHVALPVGRRVDWSTHKEFTRAFALQLARAHPDRFVTNARKSARKGKLYLDYLRNARGATAIVPYSPRARPGAPVATPLAWEELEAPLDPRQFRLGSVLERLASRPDPWARFASVRQSITKKALAAVRR